MNPKESIPTLQATARMLLPGMKHAQSLLNVSIQVLQYFATHAAHDVASGTATPVKKAEPNLIEEAEQVKAMLSAFGRLQGRGG